jgi:hypothetical protein
MEANINKICMWNAIIAIGVAAVVGGAMVAGAVVSRHL